MDRNKKAYVFIRVPWTGVGPRETEWLQQQKEMLELPRILGYVYWPQNTPPIDELLVWMEREDISGRYPRWDR